VINIMKNIIRSDDGVVGIVVAILLIGLMVSVVSLVQTVYVPKWMEQKEAEHLDEVAAQFSKLKFAIDTQFSTEQLNTPIATSITLGSKELPYLMSVRAFGNLVILPGAFKLCISNLTDTFYYSFGIIKYSSVNAYFIDQSFIYEAGSIIVSQFEGNMISIKPVFAISNQGGNTTITISSPNITGIGGKISGSGYGTTAIQTEYFGSAENCIHNVTNITITTSYRNAWEIFLNWTLEKYLDPAVYSTNVDENSIAIEFTNAPVVNLKIANFYAQIGAGWIE
jgi:hypothetical protein